MSLRRAFYVACFFAAGCGSETFVDAPKTDAAVTDAVTGAADAALPASGDAGVESSAPLRTCPPGMVPTPDACIDAHEVTRAQYTAFMTSVDGERLDLPNGCGYKTEGSSFVTIFDSSSPSYPANNVDWCDAYAYCKSVGKRLCGKIGGGSFPTGTGGLGSSEWYRACSKGGSRQVPYDLASGAATNEAGRCVIQGSAPAPVDRPGNQCEGGYGGLFDMLGNVEEWVDSCTGTESSSDCMTLGAAYDDDLSLSDSSCASIFQIGRNQRRASVGFRCCY